MTKFQLAQLQTTCALLLLSIPATAQWSSDAAVNLSVADAVSDQSQPKLVATSDGGCYVSWLDGIGSGYDVRLQRLDADGNELWPHNGVLVRDRGFSSTQDYGLAVDLTGAALLAFRDDNFAPIQITTQRVLPDGTLLFGSNGVQVANSPSSVASPKVTGVASGDLVVGWTEGSTGSTQVRRVLPNGATGSPVLVISPATGAYSLSDLRGSGDDFIVSIVHQTGSSFLSPKHIVAQKYSALGMPLWGASPIPVFDGGSLQIGNFPSFLPDGNGGAVFSWYSSSPLQCYAQRILSDGSEAFPHNGSAGSNNLANTRVSPSVAFEPASSSTFMFWEEQSGNQALSGLAGQKFDASGLPQWSAAGQTLVPLSSTQVNWVSSLLHPLSSGAAGQTYVAWIESSSFGNDIGRAAVVEDSGNFAVGPFEFASTPSGKSRLTGVVSTQGEALLAWSDNRSDSNDILAQNLQADGSLGAGATSIYCTSKLSSAGCINAIASSASSSSPTSLAGDFQITCNNVQGAKNGLLFGGVFGMANLPFNGGILCVNPPTKRGPISNSGGTSPIACDGNFSTTVNDAVIPAGLDAGAGNSGWYQYWYRDPQNGPDQLGSALSDAIQLDFQ